MGRIQSTVVDFEDGEKGHELMNVGTLKSGEKCEMDSPLETPEGMKPWKCLDFSLQDLLWISDLQKCKTMNLS